MEDKQVTPPASPLEGKDKPNFCIKCILNPGDYDYQLYSFINVHSDSEYHAKQQAIAIFTDMICAGNEPKKKLNILAEKSFLPTPTTLLSEGKERVEEDFASKARLAMNSIELDMKNGLAYYAMDVGLDEDSIEVAIFEIMEAFNDHSQTTAKEIAEKDVEIAKYKTLLDEAETTLEPLESENILLHAKLNQRDKEIADLKERVSSNEKYIGELIKRLNNSTNK